MARKQRHSLTVLESPWDDEDGDIAGHSMRPFVEGLCELHEWRLIYRTFTSSHELLRLVEGEAFDEKSERSVLYVSSHGSGGRLQAGVREHREINIAGVAERLRAGVEGVWIGACDVGLSESLQRFLERGGALWAGGYTCSIDWDTCMLIDLSILNEMMRGTAPRDTKRIVDTFNEGLMRFDPEFCVGDDGDDDVELRRALCIWGRAQGGRPQEVTDDVLDKLGWLDEDEEDDANG